MSFRENLQHLRATRTMTQAELALLLGVSRQSVAKWEAEKSYPEMDKLLKICDVFECSLDDLVRGDLTGRSCELAPNAFEDAPPTDEHGFDQHMRRRASLVAAGSTAPIFGFAVANVVITTIWRPPSGSGTAVYLACIAAGLALIAVAFFEHRAFRRAHPRIEDFYSETQKTAARRWAAASIGFGLLLMVAAPVALVPYDAFGLTTGLSMPWPWLAALVACLAFVSVGWALVVRGALMARRTNLERYNWASERHAARTAALVAKLHAASSSLARRTGDDVA